jgi:hypothetical protein
MNDAIPSGLPQKSVASVDEIQNGWHELSDRLHQLEAEKGALEQENKTLRSLMERVIDHRQKSHSELVLLLTGLVTKLPINDVGVLIARLVEHNTNVTHVLTSLLKGTTEAVMAQPEILKSLDQAKRDMKAGLQPLVDELIKLEAPLDPAMLKGLVEDPESFFQPQNVRANRCFIKGQVPRERVVKEFGDAALALFNDMTTDPKLNPNPKPEEIVLSFKPEFEALLPQRPELEGKKDELMGLYRRVQRSKGSTPEARQQRCAFQRLSFILELIHYYDHQNTEAPDVIFAQRLPLLLEQFVLAGPQDAIEEKALKHAEELLSLIISSDHRLMVINNIGKSGGNGRSLRYVLRLRQERIPDQNHVIVEFVKHLVPPGLTEAPAGEVIAAPLRLLREEMQRLMILGLMSTDRLRREQAEILGKKVAEVLGIKGIEDQARTQKAVPPEVERQMAWGKIQEMINRRLEAATIAAAIRDRLHAKYEPEELKQSWIVLTEADAISLIRIFCQIPYRPDGRTDEIARPVMESYVIRLTHEKYAATYHKILNSLKNMHKVKPDSPTLTNFIALVRWVDPDAATKMCSEIGM